jgi:hypothetical protein
VPGWQESAALPISLKSKEGLMQDSAFTAMILPVWFSASASPDVLLSIDERARVLRQLSSPGS